MNDSHPTGVSNVPLSLCLAITTKSTPDPPRRHTLCWRTRPGGQRGQGGEDHPADAGQAAQFRPSERPARQERPAAGPAQPHEHEPVERAPRHPQAKAVNRDDAAEPLGDTLDRNRSAHGMTPVEIQGPRSRRPHGRQVAPASGFARNCRLLHVRRERTASENSTHPTQNMPWRPALAPRCPAELGCQPWHTNLIAVIT